MHDVSMMFPCRIDFGAEQYQNLYDTYHNGKPAEDAWSVALHTLDKHRNPYGSMEMGALGFVVDAAQERILVFASDCHALQLDPDFYSDGINKIATIAFPKKYVTDNPEETLNNILHAVDICSKQGETVNGLKFATLANT